MDYSILEKSTMFSGIPAKELRDDLEAVPHHIQCYDKGETVQAGLVLFWKAGYKRRNLSPMGARLMFPSAILEK